jgi:ABC-type transporter Mla maintaining outer membrane lipid asymmetry ATPase subunit MlaF
MSAVLQVRDLAFVSDTARELDGIGFTLERGKSLCIVGGSGSGKSLLLRLLCGLERPSEGRILYDGTDMARASESQWRSLRRRMGVALDGAGLLSRLTLAENIVYPLLAAGADNHKLETSLEFALAYFDLYPWRTAMPGELSSGLQRRALLARATIIDPPLLICDNLFDGLHDEARSDVAGVLARSVANRGLALLYTAGSEADADLLKADVLRLA